MKINNSHPFLTDFQMWCIHTAHLIRFSQDLDIDACGVLGKCVPRHAKEMCQRAQIFIVNIDKIQEIANHPLKRRFHVI